jgi:UDP-GlcNAc:undecaprenyl-phosphate GlcNAc-1-phosphate transferase
MIDGADGLAGVLVLAALAMLGAAPFYAGNDNVYTRIPLLMGVVTGFLAYNLRMPGREYAHIFMGNAGSAFLGLTIACFAIRLTQNPAHPVGPILVLWLMPVAVMDCLVLIVRRLHHGQSPFAADRNHIHHLMQEGGFGPNRIAFMLVAFSLATGLGAGLALRAHVPQVFLAGAFVLLCLFYFWLTSRRERAMAFFRWLRHIPAITPEPGLQRQGTTD